MAIVKKAVAYYRKSSSSYKKQITSIADQRKQVRKFANRNRIKIVKEYVDDGVSGDATESRTAFLEMRDQIGKVDFELVLCWDQDRFGRFDSTDAGYWIYPFKKSGICLMTVNDGLIDWNDYSNRLMFTIKQEGKHQFLRDLSKNVLRGQLEAAKNGSWLGSVPTGYRLVGSSKKRKLVKGCADEVELVRRIFREYVKDDQASMSGVATSLNNDGVPSRRGGIWRADAIKWILRNPVYIGVYRFNIYSRSKYNCLVEGEITAGGRKGRNDQKDWVVIENHHEPLIEKRVFEKAQRKIDRNRRGKSPRYDAGDNPYLLTGKLRCGRCGGPLWGMENRKYRYYECGTRKRTKSACEGTTVREDRVLNLIQEYIEEEILSNPEKRYLNRKARGNKRAKRDGERGSDLKRIPDGFYTLKQMLFDEPVLKLDVKQVMKQVKRIEKDIKKAERNLALVDPEFLNPITESIRDLRNQRMELVQQSLNQPTDQDINDTILSVLKGLRGFSVEDPEQVKRALTEFDSITAVTRLVGRGNGIRHRLGRIEVELVGPTKSKLNPHRSG